MRQISLCVLSALVLTSWPTASWAAPIFLGLGAPAGGASSSSAIGVSDDGSVVVGQVASFDNTSQPFRWQNGVMTGLGWLPGAGTSPNGFARGVSADGSVVVGATNSAIAPTPPINSNHEPFRWQNGVVTGLGFLSIGASVPVGDATGVSADGSVIVGSSSTADGPLHAYRWQNGSMVDLGVLAGAVESQVWGVSANGAVIVGESSSSGMQEAFRWENGVMTGLGFLEGGSDSRAYGVSADGLATVGVSNLEAFLSMDGVMIGLGVLDGSFDSTAYAASDDGAIVVGASGEFFTPSAFVWDSVNGMRNLQQVLSTTYGLAGQLAGWHLQGARDISPDGRAIVGYGTNPAGMQEAWLAIIPEPSTGLLFALGVGGLAARRHGS